MAERVETAACFCGTITARFEGEPFWISSDHDDDCRRATGGAILVWVGYRPDQVTFTGGTPAHYSRTPGVVRRFCARCGTSISYEDEGTPDELYYAVGFFDQPGAFLPEAHAYWSLRLPWVDFRDDRPRVDRYSRDRDPAIGFPADRTREE